MADTSNGKSEEGFNLPKAEKKVLEFWKTNDIFAKSLSLRNKKKKFIFYEGPPYANGRPGIHHVLARVVKDVILRYKTMRGYYVPRKAGWDTHGLPVEIAAEKALGLKSKKDIEKYGIERFNEEAKKAVWLYKDEWEKMTERIGYWLDLKNAYVTYAPEYIESIWWTIAQIAKRGLLYKGHKVVPWCPRCGTALSSHELALGYKETDDNSVYVKFKLTEQSAKRLTLTNRPVYILSWTTTPWTLPGNVALAVKESTQYTMLIPDGISDVLILATELVTKIFGKFGNSSGYQLFGKVLKGKDLVGLEYEPLFNVPALKNEKSYKIYPADFVTTTDGTGVVHAAVMYGEDDYKLGVKVGLPQHHTVDEEGRFTKDVPGLAGMLAKSKDKKETEETENKIFEYLKNNGNLLKTEKYTHDYPYCWRCETPILYYARDSWFIAMSKLREKLLASNKKINWIPDYVKEGRFGEWLREVKDWNLSRERYWGAPLPIWECKKCGHTDVVQSLSELSGLAGGPKNNYWTMRHGEAESNVFNVIDSGKGNFHLTPKGKKLVVSALGKIHKSRTKIDVILASPITRTKETAELAAEILGVKKVIFDKGLEEIHLGELQGCHSKKYKEAFPTYESKFEGGPKGGESLRDLRRRVWGFLAECEKKYSGKNILLVSHEYTIWVMMHAASGWSEKRAIEEKVSREETKQNVVRPSLPRGDFVELAEADRLDFKIVPRDGTGLVDLHRPYVDEIFTKCSKCGHRSERIKEVADVWYDSGAMPFAQDHWPFDATQGKPIDRGSNGRHLPDAYPADYIAEGMDQTRGWFYTLLAIATALGRESSYKNVIALGLINDKFGQKMSKSKGNIVDPWMVMEKYGVDAVRWYFYTVNPPGEPKNFDENEVAKAFRRMHLILYNSFVFWKTYAGSAKPKSPSKNILDKWILARFSETVGVATKELDAYHIREAALAIESLIDDLSRWYIRRSRRRLQHPVDMKDFASASSTLGFVLGETAKLVAPFTPFFAEEMHARFMKDGKSKLSIHLTDWPKPKGAVDKKLVEAMAEVRRIASAVLAARATSGIKVRQPLASMEVHTTKPEIEDMYGLMEILRDEVNIKKIAFKAETNLKFDRMPLPVIDVTITPELKEEGTLRELVRMVQELRQKAGLKPKDQIILTVEAGEPAKGIVSRNDNFIKNEVGAKEIERKKSDKFDAEESSELDGEKIWLGLRKIK